MIGCVLFLFPSTPVISELPIVSYSELPIVLSLLSSLSLIILLSLSVNVIPFYFLHAVAS